MRQVRSLSTRQTLERYPYTVDVQAGTTTRVEIAEWLDQSELRGSYVRVMNSTVGVSENTWWFTYRFSNADAAFAFKIRWCGAWA